MKIKFIFKFIPVPVFYCTWFMAIHAGKSWNLFVQIHPEYKDDEGLLEHELTHCRQFWRTLWFHALRYWLDKTYRYQAELEAYKKQLAITPGNAHRFAVFIATRYNLPVTEMQAYRDLTEAM